MEHLTGTTTGIVILIVVIAGSSLYVAGRSLYFWIAPKMYKWTPEETHKRIMASQGIYSDVREALRSYSRKRSTRGFIFGVFCLGAASVPWVREFSSTDTLIWLLGVGIFWLFYQTELRLKTMQVRLAEMHDALMGVVAPERPDTVRVFRELR